MNNENQFSINAKACTLKISQDNGATILGENLSYNIPIYQRPYSWEEKQIRKFVEDIFTSYWGVDGNSVQEPMFIGTMQLSAKNAGESQDIIDGQQRLTTFLLLFKSLKARFPDCTLLEDVKLDWLKTKVNSGSQQELLDAVLASNEIETQEQNPYLNRLALINSIVGERITNEGEDTVQFDINDFASYLLSKVYFVVIETRAGLSKTLQIFDAINTTGLDLNGSDVFKIRMYEYLRDVKKEDESAFERISSLYQLMDQKNKEHQLNTGLMEILSIYQYILVARHNLPITIYNFRTEDFYDRLFDTILNVQSWDYFKNNVAGVEISLAEIEELIHVYYDWQKSRYTNAEEQCAMHFIWNSRYGKYWKLIFVFMHRFGREVDASTKLQSFIISLSKLFFIYSVRFQKIKSEFYYKFMFSLIGSLVNGSLQEVMELMAKQKGSWETHNPNWYNLDYFLSENLVDNAKRKLLVCKLSAMLEEDYQTSNTEAKDAIVDKLFDWEHRIDVEHIQSYHDRDNNKREDIWEKWGSDINSIGNLMVLEEKLNRQLSNNNYDVKTERYEESKYAIVRKQPSEFPTWDLEQCRQRKTTELKKLNDYLFS